MKSMLLFWLALIVAGTGNVSMEAAEPAPADLGTRAQGIDWPDFLGPRRDSRSPETGLAAVAADVAGGKPLRVVWQCDLGESYCAPSVSRGRLFHFDRHGDVHRLTCRNSETGAELWKYELPASFTDMLGYNNGPRATPVVDGERVYVMSPEGLLACVRAVDGKEIWKVDTLQQFGVVKNFFGVGSTPIVWGDLLIANIGGSPPGSPPNVYAAQGKVEGNGSGVVAFDKLTGKVRWQATDELASYASPVIAEVAGKRRCFVLARGGLVVLDPATGKVDFQFPWRASKLESVNASSPVIVDDQVFISEAYGPGAALLRVKPAGEHEVVWQDQPRSRERSLELHWNTAVHDAGHLYGSSGQHGGNAELRCIDLATGKVAWQEPRLSRSSLLLVDGHFVCLSEDGSLRLLRATPERYDLAAEITPRGEDGQPLLEYPAWAAPVLSHGLLYVRGANRLVCLELIP
ncbi:MAG: PQQ-like beta-propeller repeat protein [Planctomycetaceae bacterium]|nr:PQQ-like beta-propeller repeat protein [Planctomycetaceae bacterium]